MFQIDRVSGELQNKLKGPRGEGMTVLIQISSIGKYIQQCRLPPPPPVLSPQAPKLPEQDTTVRLLIEKAAF